MKLKFEQLFRIQNYSDLGNITSRLHLRFAAKYRPLSMRKIALETTDELTRGYAESLLLLLGHRREGELLRADLTRMDIEREEEIAALRTRIAAADARYQSELKKQLLLCPNQAMNLRPRLWTKGCRPSQPIGRWWNRPPLKRQECYPQTISISTLLASRRHGNTR